MDSLDPDIRRVVHDGMRQALPDARTEARVLAGLLARLPTSGAGEGGSSPADPTPTLANATGVGATLKAIVGAVVVGAAIVGGVAVANRENDTPTRPTSPALAPARASEPSPTSEAAPAPANIEPLPSPPPAEIVAPPRARPTAQPTVVAPEPPAVDDLVAETEILARAEAALASGDPERALALASEHAKRHPSGQLAIEAEAIRIAAACVANKDGAGATAEMFLRGHPRSPAAAKVQARCGAIAENDGGQ